MTAFEYITNKCLSRGNDINKSDDQSMPYSQRFFSHKMIISESEALDPSESRLAAELAALALDPALTYRLSQRHKRTLLFIQVAPIAHHHLHHPPRLRLSAYSEELEERGASGREGLVVRNTFLLEESKDQLPLNPHEEHFFEEVEERQGGEAERVIFTFILHHELYPFEPPYITASLQDHWPRVDDGRNYFYDIMRTDCWWPLLSLADIVQQLPSFAHQLLLSIKSQKSAAYGQFEMQVPLYREDLLEVSAHFFPCRLQLKQSKGLASYRHTWAYFTYTAVVILEEQLANVFFVRSIIPVRQFASVKGATGQAGYKMALQTKDGTCYKLKWADEQMEDELMSRIVLFQLYYQVMTEDSTKGRSQTLKIIEICSQIIVQADTLRLPQAARWAKRKILEAAALLQ